MKKVFKEEKSPRVSLYFVNDELQMYCSAVHVISFAIYSVWALTLRLRRFDFWCKEEEVESAGSILFFYFALANVYLSISEVVHIRSFFPREYCCIYFCHHRQRTVFRCSVYSFGDIITNIYQWKRGVCVHILVNHSMCAVTLKHISVCTSCILLSSYYALLHFSHNSFCHTYRSWEKRFRYQKKNIKGEREKN